MIYALLIVCSLMAFVILQQQMERDKWRIERQELLNRLAAPGLLIAQDKKEIEWEPVAPDELAGVGMDLDQFEEPNGDGS